MKDFGNFEIIELEFKKLLNEYNAFLFSTVTLTLGVLGFVYQASRDLTASIFLAIVAYFFLIAKKNEAEDKLNEKINEAKEII